MPTERAGAGAAPYVSAAFEEPSIWNQLLLLLYNSGSWGLGSAAHNLVLIWGAQGESATPNVLCGKPMLALNEGSFIALSV